MPVSNACQYHCHYFRTHPGKTQEPDQENLDLCMFPHLEITVRSTPIYVFNYFYMYEIYPSWRSCPGPPLKKKHQDQQQQQGDKFPAEHQDRKREQERREKKKRRYGLEGQETSMREKQNQSFDKEQKNNETERSAKCHTSFSQLPSCIILMLCVLKTRI